MEDGVCLGTLLGLRKDSPSDISLNSILDLYCRLRKERTALQLHGALKNRALFHMEDEAARQERNRVFKEATWDDRSDSFEWTLANMDYQRKLHGYDAILATQTAFREHFEIHA